MRRLRLAALFGLLTLAVSAAAAQEAEPCPGALPPLPRNPDPYAVVADALAGPVRAAPALDAEVLSEAALDDVVVLLNGTACADGYRWREVVDEGVQGWAVESGGGRQLLAPWVAPEPVEVGQRDGDVMRVESDVLAFTYSAPPLPETVLMSDRPGYSYREAMSPQPSYRFYQLGEVDAESGNFQRAGHITVYETADWRAIGGWTEGSVHALRSLLDRRVRLPERDELGRELNIPVLPAQNAAQLLRAHPLYVDFADGPGLRFVAYYTQMTGQISTHFSYIFQGLTESGDAQISAQFEVTVPDAALPPFDDTRFLAEYQDPATPGDYYLAYVDTVTANVNALPADAFTPSLDVLDALVQSMTIRGIP